MLDERSVTLAALTGMIAGGNGNAARYISLVAMALRANVARMPETI